MQFWIRKLAPRANVGDRNPVAGLAVHEVGLPAFRAMEGAGLVGRIEASDFDRFYSMVVVLLAAHELKANVSIKSPSSPHCIRTSLVSHSYCLINIIKMVRPEGVEPPTLRSVV